MKTEEPENQVTLVTQTICLAKKCLDLIVDAVHPEVVGRLGWTTSPPDGKTGA